MEKTTLRHRIRQIVVIIASISVFYSFSNRHPYHLAVTTVTYTAQDSTINIEYKAFYHDFEDAVNKLNGTEMDIKNPDDVAKRDNAVYGYMIKCFSIMVDGKGVDCSKAGISFKEEHIIIRYIIKHVKAHRVEIKNAALYEEPTQTNLYHFISGKTKVSKKVVNPEYTVNHVFN